MRFFSFVGCLVLFQVPFIFETSTAGGTLKWFFSIVTFHVAPQCRAINESPLTLGTLVRPLPGVNSRVHLEVIGAGEGFVAGETGEGSLFRVRS